MSPLFGKKNGPSTVAVLDIESGSVGSALTQLSKKQAPKLLGQGRSTLAARKGRSAAALLGEIEQEIERSLNRLSDISLRLAQRVPDTKIDRVAVFLHAPWISVALAERPKADAHEETLSRLRPPASMLGVPVTFHAFSTTATPIVHGIFGQPKESLVISIGAEVSELSLLQNGVISAYSTVPAGLNTVLRTLESHAGITRHEAISILTLSRANREHAWAEALAAGIASLTQELQSGASSILLGSSGAQQIFVLSREPGAELFARSLAESDSLQSLFETGSTVRPVLSRHVSPHLSLHPAHPDTALLLESIFVDTRFGA